MISKTSCWPCVCSSRKTSVVCGISDFGEGCKVAQRQVANVAGGLGMGSITEPYLYVPTLLNQPLSCHVEQPMPSPV